MTIGAWRAAVAASAALALVVAGCGSSSNDNSSSTPKAGSAPAGSSAKKGGDLKVLYAADVDFMDPRATYYQYGFLVAYATQRPLYSYKPDDAKTPEPDLAEGPPDISSDGKTVTVKIRSGVKFSPPVNREVTSKDVKYALESGFTKTVNGPYVGAYMGDLHGLKAFQDGKADNISGIETPDDQTIVFKLDRPRGAIVAGMLSMPASAPVPEEYAKKFDAENPSAYGKHVVATGPYMVQNDAQGNLTGWKPNESIKLVRNPNWDAKTDYKPAYLDTITIQEGVDPQVASRQILSGQGMASGDFQVPAETLASTSRNPSQKAQLVLTPPTGRYRYIALNTRNKPFDNINVRKAISAAFDRNALRQAFGGPLTGDIPTHWLPPGQPGFDEAGGAQGPGDDFMAKPGGDMALATEYMKKAGYPSGKYTGNQTFTAVSDSATQQKNVGEVAQAQFAKLGFKVNTRYVVRNTMYTKFCQVPKAAVAICPNLGWGADFFAAQSFFDPLFNGANIVPSGNVNTAQVNDPQINAKINKAKEITDPTANAKAWADLDKEVTNQAYFVTWLWDNDIILASTNVKAVPSKFNSGAADMVFSSLK